MGTRHRCRKLQQKILQIISLTCESLRSFSCFSQVVSEELFYHPYHLFQTSDPDRSFDQARSRRWKTLYSVLTAFQHLRNQIYRLWLCEILWDDLNLQNAWLVLKVDLRWRLQLQRRNPLRPLGRCPKHPSALNNRKTGGIFQTSCE